jgi:hypothetical protein
MEVKKKNKLEMICSWKFVAVKQQKYIYCKECSGLYESRIYNCRYWLPRGNTNAN